MRRVMTHDELVANGWVSHPQGMFEWAWYQHPLYAGQDLHYKALGRPVCRNKDYVLHPTLSMKLYVSEFAIVETK